MRRRIVPLIIGAVLIGGLVQAQGCIVNDGRSELEGEDDAGTGGNATGGDGGTNFTTGGQDQGGTGGAVENPCGSECGDEELCNSATIGLDDDCDGEVDEGCACGSGLTQACFKGDPSYRGSEGCFPGTQHCSELGTWGPCVGGVHATEACYEGHTGCHAISSVPFVTADLAEGTGDFSMDAISAVFEVTCPSGVDPCPAVQNISDYIPLQSGEYTVTYTKTTATGEDSCTYPLFIGAPGLRVEISWEHPENDPANGVDVDLHLHKPNDTSAWAASSGNAVDCAYSNCTASACKSGGCPTWFNGVAPPDPVKWYLDPVFEKNTCYFGPRGTGAIWQQAPAMGCHNPRLDSDNITCDPTITDSQNSQFCNPENINVDFPPANEWTRIGVHYYSSHGATYDVHPVVKIFCDGKLAAELGGAGYFDPTAPVTFKPSEGSTRFWMVADVAFLDDGCEDTICMVHPLYQNDVAKTPYFVTTSQAQGSFGPAYPPPPGN